MERFELQDWEISGYYPYIPLLGMESPNLGRSITDWIPATVPGSVHSDLWKAGWIEDPYFGMNSLACEWVENRWWAYRTRFSCALDEKKRYWLHMAGLDYRCRIYLNDHFLALHEGSFVPFRMDVTDKLVSEDNTLLVLFEAAPDEDSQAGHTLHTHTQKSRFSYKWDFSTRMVPVGIWDRAWIEETGSGTIQDVWLLPELKGERGKVALRANCAFGRDETASDYEVTLRILREGAPVAEARERFPIGQGQSQAQMEVWLEHPEVWYPNGMGGQPLYEAELALSLNGDISHRWRGRIGFKNLRWIQNEGSPSDALPYCLEVNGKRCYLKGVNLTPFDMLIGTVTEERYRCYLRQIQAANINLVRVNGVGLIEKECFYDLCDEFGILVWQEFIQTSSSMDRIPPVTPGYLKLLGETSAAAIRQKRNHVCLACYSGGNELTDAPGKAATYQNPNIQFLRKLVDTYDTGRMLFPSSASGPHEFLEMNRPGGNHDVHGPWNFHPEEHYLLFNQSDSLLHGELGAEGMAAVESLKKFLPPKDLTVASMRDNLTWRHHGDWWDTLDRDQALFGNLPDLRRFAAASQLMQAEGIRYALESNRRRKYQNSGSMMWAFNEPFPNVSNTCLVDYYGVAKMAYYATRDAYAPLNLSLRYEKLVFAPGEPFRAKIFLNNSLDETSVSWSARILNLRGIVLAERRGCVSAPANAVIPLEELCMDVEDHAPEVFMVRLRSMCDGRETLNEYLFSTRRDAPFQTLMSMGDSRLQWELADEREGDGFETKIYRVKNVGSEIALFVRADLPEQNEFVFAQENYKSLLPGEERLYHVTSWLPGKNWQRCEFVALL